MKCLGCDLELAVGADRHGRTFLTEGTTSTEHTKERCLGFRVDAPLHELCFSAAVSHLDAYGESTASLETRARLMAGAIAEVVLNDRVKQGTAPELDDPTFLIVQREDLAVLWEAAISLMRTSYPTPTTSRTVI